MISLLEKTQLLRGLMTGELSYTPPFFVSLDLTRRCNLNCRFCRFHSPLSNFPSPLETSLADMPVDMLLKFFEDFRKNSVKEIIFAGEGEPFLYPNFLDAVAAAKSADMHLNVVTNGTMLNAETIEKLVDMKLDLLTVSLWASSEEEYAKLYPGTNPEYFHKVIDGLKLVTSIKERKKSRYPNLRIHRPVSPENFATVEKLVEQARVTGCNQVSVTPTHPLKTDAISCMLSKEQEEAVFSSLIRIKKRLNKYSIDHNIDTALMLYKIGESVWETLPCYIGWIYARIRMDGTVFPCSRCDLPIGNLNESSLEEIRNNDAYRSFRKKASTRQGLESLSNDCLCSYCCHIRNNMKIHKMFKWMRPFVPAI